MNSIVFNIPWLGGILQQLANTIENSVYPPHGDCSRRLEKIDQPECLYKNGSCFIWLCRQYPPKAINEEFPANSLHLQMMSKKIEINPELWMTSAGQENFVSRGNYFCNMYAIFYNKNNINFYSQSLRIWNINLCDVKMDFSLSRYLYNFMIGFLNILNVIPIRKMHIFWYLLNEFTTS